MPKNEQAQAEEKKQNQESVEKTGSYSARRKDGTTPKNRLNDLGKKATTKVAKSVADKVAPGIGGKVVDKLAGNSSKKKPENAPNPGNNPLTNKASKLVNPPGMRPHVPLPFGNHQKEESEDTVQAEQDETEETVLNKKRKRRNIFSSKNMNVEGKIDIKAFLKKMIPVLIPAAVVVIMLIFVATFMVIEQMDQFNPMLGVNSKTGGKTGDEEYESDTEEEEAFYERVKKISDEYKGENVTVNSQAVAAVYVIAQSHNDKLSMDDMDEDTIRKIIEATFDSNSESKTYDEDIFKENLINNILPDLVPGKSHDEYEGMTEEIFEYIETYEDFILGGEEENTGLEENNLYWWPVGSAETTIENGKVFAKGAPVSTHISSYFAGRVHPVTGVVSHHSGMDITGGTPAYGVVNIIAALDGVVVYPTAGTQMCFSGGDTSCGGQLGNYVVIQHNDGNFTVYGHMHQATVTVKAGDVVKQGQVIGKMGSSGMSTGTHLHFEVRVGANHRNFGVDPLEYVDPDNPRPVSSNGVFSQEFVTFLHSWEGLGHAPSGDNYVAYNDGTGTVTVGYGIAVKYNLDRFAQFGIDGNSIHVGSLVPIAIVDKIEQMELTDNYNSIKLDLVAASINLNSKQIEALVSRKYNTGNIRGFATAYRTYGDTQALYDNYMARPVTGVGVGFMPGLKRRRDAEWALFHNGQYINNG